MIRRTQKSALLPYTTLFRTRPSACGESPDRRAARTHTPAERSARPREPDDRDVGEEGEQVSQDRKSTRPELQSRQYLVCRLLLEKKKILLPHTHLKHTFWLT